MLLINYNYVITHLKLNIARRSFFFDIYVNNRILSFLTILYKLNVIRRFSKLTPKKYRIFLFWRDNSINNTRIKVYNRGSNRIQLQLSALRILTQQTYNTNLILSTSKGILTHQQAIKANVGGFLICSIL